MQKKLYILDVSGYIFRAYFALPPLTSPKGESTGGLYGFIRSVLKLFKEFSPEHIVAVFDGPDNKKQRLEIYEKYKANRIKLYEDLPDQIERAKEFCHLLGIAIADVAGVEADDTIGSIAKWSETQDATVFICTADKDLCQLVNERIFLLNTWKENLVIDRQKVEEIHGVTPEQIVDYLAIVGDTSDNIPGLKGFGPKTTVPLLKQYGTLDNLLAHADEIKGESKKKILKEGVEIAHLSKRLATIYTDVEFVKDDTLFAKQTPHYAHLRDFYLEMGFQTLVKEIDQAVGKKEELDTVYTLVNTQEDLNALLKTLSQAEEICFDTETTELHPQKASLVGIGFCIKEKEAYYVPVNGAIAKSFVIEKLKPLFENPSLKFYGHNVKYDMHILKNEGIDFPRLGFDTMLASYLLHPQSRRHSLDHLSLEYFGKVKTNIKELIGSGKKEISMQDVALDKVSAYCCEDVDYTVRLKNSLEKELKERHLLSLLLDLELPLSTVLAKMEREGIFLDTASLQETGSIVTAELKRLEEEIYLLAQEEFNIASSQQLAHILFEKMGIKPLKKTLTGFSTRAEVLEELAKDHLICQKLLQWRTLEKLRSTYLESLLQDIHPKTGRIHPNFNQVVAATGRLSCQDPNLQNIPVRSPLGKKIRSAFRPQKKGFSFLAADYSQVELRLLAHLSEDPHLLDAFQKGEDVHRYTASLVFNTPYDKVTDVERFRAKAINFGIIYGQQAYGLSQELKIDIRQAAQFIEAYFERYPKVFEFIQKCIENTRKTGKAVTLTGRERPIADIHSPNAILRQAAERLAINTPLQGSSADLTKLAMLVIDKKLEGKRASMLLQIHDELIFEVADEYVEELKILVKEAMEGVFSLRVPLIVDVFVGKNWGEC